MVSLQQEGVFRDSRLSGLMEACGSAAPGLRTIALATLSHNLAKSIKEKVYEPNSLSGGRYLLLQVHAFLLYYLESLIPYLSKGYRDYGSTYIVQFTSGNYLIPEGKIA